MEVFRYGKVFPSEKSWYLRKHLLKFSMIQLTYHSSEFEEM